MKKKFDYFGFFNRFEFHCENYMKNSFFFWISLKWRYFLLKITIIKNSTKEGHIIIIKILHKRLFFFHMNFFMLLRHLCSCFWYLIQCEEQKNERILSSLSTLCVVQHIKIENSLESVINKIFVSLSFQLSFHFQFLWIHRAELTSVRFVR